MTATQEALVDYVARAELVFRGIRWRGFGDATVTYWCEQMEDQARLLVDAFNTTPESDRVEAT